MKKIKNYNYIMLCCRCSKYSEIGLNKCPHCGNDGKDKHFLKCKRSWQDFYKEGNLEAVYKNWVGLTDSPLFPYVIKIIKYKENDTKKNALIDKLEEVIGVWDTECPATIEDYMEGLKLELEKIKNGK